MKIELDLNQEIVEKIEELVGISIKELLEKEINEDGDVFIEMMGYDNI